jgi:hypothetical protein
MQLLGASHQFLTDVLPPDYRPEIFDMVEAAWPHVPNPMLAWLEPRITGLLRVALIAEQESRYMTDPPFHISEEVKKRDPITGIEFERTDVELHLRHHYIKGQKPYFVFESKRLNIPYYNYLKSNADEYVGDEGMGCLFDGRYESVPSFSGMIGFLMNGDAASAKQAIEDILQKNIDRLCLKPTAQIQASQFVFSKQVGETHHEREGRRFVIFHIFLPVRQSANTDQCQ